MDSYDELLELVLAYSSNQVKYLARWIISYNRADNKKEQDLHLERLLYLNRFQKMVDTYEAAQHKERPGLDTGLFDYYSSYIKAMIPNAHRRGLDELCFTSRWREAASLVADINEDIEASRYEREYERLVTDSEYLISQVVRIMKAEYAKRLETTRKAMAEYIEPHRSALERLGANLQEAREGLARVERSGLLPIDRESIARGIEERVAEMEAMRARELENLRGVRAFVDEVQKAAAMFNAVIALVERKRDQIEERKRLLGLVARLDIETPEMDELFRGMSGGLERSIAHIRESFALLNSAFQDRIVDIIGDQEKMNRILESSGAFAETCEGGGPDHDCYEEVLRILKSL